MELTTSHHRLIQAVISMIVLQVALFTGDLLKIVTVMALLIIAWGLLLVIQLIEWSNDEPPATPETIHQTHKKRW
ncbi:MAG: hypothetical protein KDJ52_29175 [Anaerolineae bacterium]|nr:hypothetical protein [Anaerolineae bacterium]